MLTSPDFAARARATAEDLGRFVQASPSSYHAARHAAERLRDAGFVQLDETESWSGRGAGRFFVVRDGAVLAWIAPEQADRVTIVGTHTDSPGVKLKPAVETSRAGLRQASVEVYGGPLFNSWLDRELEFAGQVVGLDGAVRLVRTGPILRIPQLAVHLDRGVNAEGLKLDPQRHLRPVFGLDAGDDAGSARLLPLLATLAGLAPDEVGGFDLYSVDTQPPAVFGIDGEFLASGRLDNLSSLHASLTALLDAADAPETGAIRMIAAFDHEEIGSSSRTGAAGPLLAEVLHRILRARGVDEPEAFFARSFLVSADASHAVHPNYAERHDDLDRPLAGRGILLKSNANQRYATDAVGLAAVTRAARAAEVPLQHFVANNTMPSGSTIGPISATRLGIRTLDLGVPLLSMHSARELVAVADLERLRALLGAVFAGA